MSSGAEGWAAAGQEFDDHENCPYCGQSTVGVDLIGAYKTYFNAEFRSLQAAINSIRLALDRTLPIDLSEQIARQVTMGNEALSYWSGRALVSKVDFDEIAFDASLKKLREYLIESTSAKQSSIGTWMPSADDSRRINENWEQLLKTIEDANAVIATNATAIAEYKTTLNALDIAEIRRELLSLEQAEHRHSAVVAPLLVELDNAQSAVKDAERSKRAAQTNMTKVMNETLSKYQDSTNTYLRNLGATFKLVELKGNNHSGGTSTYAIELRGQTVQLEGNGPNFSNTLSESEKRTLALAFFCASVLDSKDVADQVVVFDDPVSSYDKARLGRTVELLTSVAGKTQQLIVLSHNAHFLLALDGKLEKAKIEKTQRTHLEIRRSEHEYSDFARFDLEKACESEYFRNFRLLEEFHAGAALDHLTVARAIRPTVEGYLHRRFPSPLKGAHTLGLVITLVEGSNDSSPLANAKHLIPELHALNEWASQPHHAASRTSAIPPDAMEVLDYCRRALDVIWAG